MSTRYLDDDYPDVEHFYDVMGSLVDAWLDRRTARAGLCGPLSWAGVEGRTDGVSIFGPGMYSDEAVLTRARNGFLAIFSRKRYRFRAWRMLQGQLLAVLVAREIPFHAVDPPYSALCVTPELLQQWWEGWLPWSKRTPEQTAKRFDVFAARALEAIYGGAEFVYFDHYVDLTANKFAVKAWCETVLHRTQADDAPLLLSGVKYPKDGVRYRIREALRREMDRQRIQYNVISPITRSSGTTEPKDLFRTWYEQQMRVEG